MSSSGHVVSPEIGSGLAMDQGGHTWVGQFINRAKHEGGLVTRTGSTGDGPM